MAGQIRNRWQDSTGIPGSFKPESVAGLLRILHEVIVLCLNDEFESPKTVTQTTREQICEVTKTVRKSANRKVTEQIDIIRKKEELPE